MKNFSKKPEMVFRIHQKTITRNEYEFASITDYLQDNVRLCSALSMDGWTPQLRLKFINGSSASAKNGPEREVFA